MITGPAALELGVQERLERAEKEVNIYSTGHTNTISVVIGMMPVDTQLNGDTTNCYVVGLEHRCIQYFPVPFVEHGKLVV